MLDCLKIILKVVQSKFPIFSLNFAEQASWAELVLPSGLSDQKINLGFIIRVENLSF